MDVIPKHAPIIITQADIQVITQAIHQRRDDLVRYKKKSIQAAVFFATKEVFDYSYQKWQCFAPAIAATGTYLADIHRDHNNSIRLSGELYLATAHALEIAEVNQGTECGECFQKLKIVDSNWPRETSQD